MIRYHKLKVNSEKSKRKTKSKKSLCLCGEKSLNDLFNRRPELKKAWLRGVFLRNIADYAATPKTIAEAGIAMGMEPGALEKLFASDFEAADTWNKSRDKKRIEIEDAFMNKAIETCSISAIKQMQKLMSREVVPPAADFTRVSTKSMMELTKYSRETLQVDWPNKGLSRNIDGTYNLLTFFGWFEDYISKKAMPQKQENPAANEKARKYKIENDERIGKLLDRNKVILSFAARLQTDMRIFSKYLAEQKDPFVKQTLERIFEESRRERTKAMPELKLNEELTENLKDLLEKIADSTEKSHREEVAETKNDGK